MDDGQQQAGDVQQALAERFEAHRGQLRGVAHRMLGSLSDADDAVQEAWLRLSRTDAEEIGNLAAWLRTVVSRLCLDMLRSGAARHEEAVGGTLPDYLGGRAAWRGSEPQEPQEPEEQALVAESVGRALLVVLDTLGPAERVAFVLHDLFAVPFAQIAPVVERTPVATKKLASRARGKVRGAPRAAAPEFEEERRVVEAFLAAARSGDLAALLTVLAPDVVRDADLTALPGGRAARIQGARAVAEETVLLRRNARFAEPALIDGTVGLVVAPCGRLLLALRIRVEGGRVAAYEVIADRRRLRALDLAVLPAAGAGTAAGGSTGRHPSSSRRVMY
ncbi:sigma-70 family RNA polymerase sigma factor [Streptomyces sp. KN37]|uniref:sigma-70 family RNA polymerase sigma factor n=1 Tax=Streptomyces sp. KN37 TaxID=3090667 RepID=UPI002A754C43|nr:sigma-70 family RNA polymerase sigma factor [Streptomyces sp. KN37]WPO70722.1 sigma-70 family RNA polymerase sigma factor [Streptomyces sp. KN37]